MTSDEAKAQLDADRLTRGLTQIDKTAFDADFDVQEDAFGTADAAYAACVVRLDAIVAALGAK